MISKDTLSFFGEGILEQYPHDKMLAAYKDVARDVSRAYGISHVINCSMIIGHLMTKYPLDDDYIDHLKKLLNKMKKNARRGMYDSRF